MTLSPPTPGTPTSDVEIDTELVSRLLGDQHPDLGNLPIRQLDIGWDNVMYRLGDELLLRLPRRDIAAHLVRHEQEALPQLAPLLPLAVPAPVKVGTPTDYYPYHWSVMPFLPGRTADEDQPTDDQAQVMANFLACLHQPAPADAPVNEVRGVPLRDRQAAVEKRFDRLREKTDLLSPAVLKAWEDGLAAPDADNCLWLHGDMHPRNILCNDGQLTAIIDWGDVTSGDCATDLATFWMLFDDPSLRQKTLRDIYGADDALYTRARGWAAMFGIVLLDSGLIDHPAHARIGADTLRRLAED